MVTDGASKLSTVEDLLQEDLQAAGIVTMMDREEGGAENLGSAGVDFVPIIGLSAAVRILLDAHRIGSQELGWITKYHEGLRADGLATSFAMS